MRIAAVVSAVEGVPNPVIERPRIVLPPGPTKLKPMVDAASAAPETSTNGWPVVKLYPAWVIPSMKTGSPMSGSGKLSWIFWLPIARIANAMMSGPPPPLRVLFALVIACRSDPGPESAVVVTRKAFWFGSASSSATLNGVETTGNAPAFDAVNDSR